MELAFNNKNPLQKSIIITKRMTIEKRILSIFWILENSFVIQTRLEHLKEFKNVCQAENSVLSNAVFFSYIKALKFSKGFCKIESG